MDHCNLNGWPACGVAVGSDGEGAPSTGVTAGATVAVGASRTVLGGKVAVADGEPVGVSVAVGVPAVVGRGGKSL